MFRNPSFDDQNDSGNDYVSIDNICVPSSSDTPATAQRDAPDTERNQYSNKETLKVNAGLEFCQAKTIAIGEENPHVPVYEVAETCLDFSGLINSIIISQPKPSVERLAYCLLHPPSHAFIYGVLSFRWVFGVLGMDHIQFRSEDERYMLSETSELRSRGAELGLPAAYCEWLSGDDEMLSATEQSMALTPKFFEQIHKERARELDN